jgi:cytochrome P450
VDYFICLIITVPFSHLLIVVLAQIAQLHHNADFFPEPNNFFPERWIPEESPFPPIQDFTFYPFSAGTRNCVGKNFAM